MAVNKERTKFGHAMKKHFMFDPDWVNLNHGSFGTYPKSVRDALRRHQDRTEAAPDRFLKYEYTELLDESRRLVAGLLNAPVDECVFVLNATTGINTVLRNLTWQPQDAIVYFDTCYSAIEKTLVSLVETNPQIHLRRIGPGEKVDYRLPCSHADILNAFNQTISCLIYEGFNPKVAVFDTIVSLPGVRFPFERLTKMCKEYGILSVIDAAHAIGQIPLDMTALDPDFLVSNCHKWLYTPRGSAVFFVPKRNQHLIRTTFPTSHGFVPPPEFRIRTVLPPSTQSEFVNNFQFTGTADSSPFYCVAAAMEFRENICGGEQTIMTYVRDLAQTGADLIAKILGTEVMDDCDLEERPQKISGGSSAWVGGIRDCFMANILLPIVIEESQWASKSKDFGGATIKRKDVQKHVDWILHELTFVHQTRVLVYEYNDRVWIRVSGQIYLELQDFEWIGGILKDLCKRVRNGESLQLEHNSKSINGNNLDHRTTDMDVKNTNLDIVSNGTAMMALVDVPEE